MTADSDFSLAVVFKLLYVIGHPMNIKQPCEFVITDTLWSLSICCHVVLCHIKQNSAAHVRPVTHISSQLINTLERLSVVTDE